MAKSHSTMTKRLFFATLLFLGAVCSINADDERSVFFYLKDGNVCVAGMSEFENLTFKDGTIYVNDTLGVSLSEIDSLRFEENPEN